MAALTMHRMRCRACRRPWAATTTTAGAPCPFCGHRHTTSALGVLAEAFPAARRHAWLFARRDA